jgi:hypothetical protein
VTHYGIRTIARLPTDQRWASVPYAGVTKWIENDRMAIRSDSMTRMLTYAVDFLDLDPATFTIEALPAIVPAAPLRSRS